MGFVQEIECPYCKRVFPLPKRRHWPGVSKYGGSVTLCGISDRGGELLVKEGEAVNCRTCERKRKAAERSVPRGTI